MICADIWFPPASSGSSQTNSEYTELAVDVTSRYRLLTCYPTNKWRKLVLLPVGVEKVTEIRR